MSKVYAIWASGVDRWHANRSHLLRRSCDTTDAHTARCLHLLFALWKGNDTPPSSLVKAILDHDVPEAWVGDVPLSSKKTYDNLKESLRKAEGSVLGALDLSKTSELTTQHRTWAKLVDTLDAYLWAWRVDPREAGRPEWVDLRRTILSYAEAADVVKNVVALLEYAEGGYVRPEIVK